MQDKNSHQGSNGVVATTFPKIVMEGAEPAGVTNNTANSERTTTASVTNEYVLNVAFYTFVGFLLSEAVFAIIAGSESMLEDAEAMSVDALTYLFNLWAERIKHRPYTEEELQLPIPVRNYRREMTRLYVELIPPFLSVSTLVVVTIFATRDALEEFLHSGEDEDENDVAKPNVNINIMLWFSGANLLLDLVNVTCFARANQAFGLSIPSQRRQSTNGSGEMQSLLEQGSLNRINDNEESCLYHHEHISLSLRPSPVDSDSFVNLNMCSAWTHVCADTLRSVSVLIAASIASIFRDTVSGSLADSLAVIVVSVIILISLVPLVHGLCQTANKILDMRGKEPVTETTNFFK